MNWYPINCLLLLTCWLIVFALSHSSKSPNYLKTKECWFGFIILPILIRSSSPCDAFPMFLGGQVIPQRSVEDVWLIIPQNRRVTRYQKSSVRDPFPSWDEPCLYCSKQKKERSKSVSHIDGWITIILSILSIYQKYILLSKHQLPTWQKSKILHADHSWYIEPLGSPGEKKARPNCQVAIGPCGQAQLQHLPLMVSFCQEK